MAAYIKCPRCSFNYDRMEIISGICEDCRREQKKLEVRKSKVIKDGISRKNRINIS